MKHTRLFRNFVYRVSHTLTTEWRLIFRDKGAVLILLLAVLIYSTLYSLGYGGEILRDVPIVVVDESRTPQSRHLIRMLDSSPNIEVAFEAESMPEAQCLFFARRAYGIVLIPAEYARSLVTGRQTTIAAYCDAGYLLIYRQTLEAVSTVVQSEGVSVVQRRLELSGRTASEAAIVATPVSLHTHNLYNPSLGYGVFVMPAVLILILQQTALVGIGLVCGTRNEFGRQRTHAPFATLIGRTVAYAALYSVTATYIFVLHYRLFEYPMNGSTEACVVLLALFITASVLLGLSLSPLYSRREESLMLLFWSSIPALLVSGVSLPHEAFPQWLHMLGRLLPSSNAVEGYIRIQSAGASLADVAPQIATLGALVVLYGTTAYIAIRRGR